MKKVLLGSLALLFAVAMIVTACDDDVTEECVTCHDGDVDYEVCWDKNRPLDMAIKIAEWGEDHPNGYCDDL